MVFKKREENGGEVDPNQWTKGRPKGSGKKLSRGDIKDKELLALMRKVKPHLAKAYVEVAKILNKEEASDQNKLKAAAFFDSVYRQMVNEVYDVDNIAEVEEVQPQQTGAVFSLKMINADEGTGTEG